MAGFKDYPDNHRIKKSLNPVNHGSDVYYLYTVQNLQPDPKILIDIVQTRMPYGKYKGTIIADIPISYLEWMAGKGFSKDKMGMLLSTTFEIKTNGLSDILLMVKRSIKQRNS